MICMCGCFVLRLMSSVVSVVEGVVFVLMSNVDVWFICDFSFGLVCNVLDVVV